jgi:hypothetical protein
MIVLFIAFFYGYKLTQVDTRLTGLLLACSLSHTQVSKLTMRREALVIASEEAHVGVQVCVCVCVCVCVIERERESAGACDTHTHTHTHTHIQTVCVENAQHGGRVGAVTASPACSETPTGMSCMSCRMQSNAYRPSPLPVSLSLSVHQCINSAA